MTAAIEQPQQMMRRIENEYGPELAGLFGKLAQLYVLDDRAVLALDNLVSVMLDESGDGA